MQKKYFCTRTQWSEAPPACGGRKSAEECRNSLRLCRHLRICEANVRLLPATHKHKTAQLFTVHPVGHRQSPRIPCASCAFDYRKRTLHHSARHTLWSFLGNFLHRSRLSGMAQGQTAGSRRVSRKVCGMGGMGIMGTIGQIHVPHKICG